MAAIQSSCMPKQAERCGVACDELFRKNQEHSIAGSDPIQNNVMDRLAES